MRVLLAALSMLVLVPVADAGVQCGTFSAHSRRCFFSFYQPCMKKTGDETLCHAQSNGCRDCNEKLFACWKNLKERSQCGTCSKVYDRCMGPVVKKQNAIDKSKKKPSNKH